MSSVPDRRTPESPPAARRPWPKVVLLAAVALAIALYLRRSGPEAWANLGLRPRYLAPLVAVEASLLLLRGLLTRTLCALFGVRLTVPESMRLAAWTALANYVTPFVGGTGLRAAYLRSRHRLALADFVSVQAATYTLHFTIASAVGLAGLALLPGELSGVRLSLAWVLAAILGGCLLLHRWPFRAPAGEGRLATALRRALEGWRRIRAVEIGPLTLLLVANMILQAIATWLGFALLGISLGAIAALFVAAIYSLSILISLTPASLGISEGAVAFAAAVAGFPAPTALAAAAARRLVGLAAVVLCAGVGQLAMKRANGRSEEGPGA